MGNYEYVFEDTHKYKPLALKKMSPLESVLSKLISIYVKLLRSPAVSFQKKVFPSGK